MQNNSNTNKIGIIYFIFAFIIQMNDLKIVHCNDECKNFIRQQRGSHFSWSDMMLILKNFWCKVVFINIVSFWLILSRFHWSRPIFWLFQLKKVSAMDLRVEVGVIFLTSKDPVTYVWAALLIFIQFIDHEWTFRQEVRMASSVRGEGHHLAPWRVRFDGDFFYRFSLHFILRH